MDFYTKKYHSSSGRTNYRDTPSSFFSKLVVYPLWDIKDRSVMLKTLRTLNITQWAEEKRLKEVQWMKLNRIIQYAYENCEYYRKLFDQEGIRPSSIKGLAEFSRIPILRKKEIKRNIDTMVSRSFKKESLNKAKTGGSTGTSLTLLFDRQCQEKRNAAAMRSDMWAGWCLGMKKAAIWGNPPIAKTFKEKVRSRLLERTIYLDTMNLNEKSMTEFVDIYRKYRPEVIFGHAHSIFMFAKFLMSQGITDLLPRGIISTSMMLLKKEREVIEKVFRCKVTNRYGCEEVGLIACECEKHEGMHLNIDHLYIEIVKDDGSPASPRERGTIVVTDMINRGMPLIRYRVEDVGILSDKPCSCGRGLPVLQEVTGRVADFLIKKDGSLVAGVSLVERTLTAIEGIEQMQIVQDEVNKLSLNIVTGDNYTEKSEKKLISEFIRVFGEEVSVQIDRVDRIVQDECGKYRFSVCNVNNCRGDE